MPHCSAYNCSNEYGSDNVVSFHRLPSNKKVADVWVKKINRNDKAWLERIKTPEKLKNIYLCSLHFSEESFDKSYDMRQRFMTPTSSRKGGRKLLSGAIPTLFPHRVEASSRVCSEKRAQRKQQSEVTVPFITIFSAKMKTCGFSIPFYNMFLIFCA